MCDPQERIIAVLEATLSHVSGTASQNQNLSARDMTRVREAVAMIEGSPEENLDLMRLSVVAGMSRYHFLRVFRRVSGVTPYQCLLAARLRRAAFGRQPNPPPN